MAEKIYDALFTLGRILHWFGRFPEMQCVDALAVLLREKGIEDWQDATDFLHTLTPGAEGEKSGEGE